MAIKVTRKWTEERLSRAAPWTADSIYEVTGTRDPGIAVTCVDPVSGLRVPQENDAFTPGNSLVCEGPKVQSRPSLEHWIIGAHFAIPPSGTYEQFPLEPLLQPVRCRAERYVISEPTDHDLDGRVLFNAAGDLISGACREVELIAWTFRKNYPFWNSVWNDTWSNAVNSAPVVIAGVRFEAQHALCLGVAPAEEFLETAKFVTVDWRFVGAPVGLLGKYPWQHRFVNAGLQGWFNDGGTPRKAKFSVKGALGGGAYDTINEPVLLKADGTPVTSGKFARTDVTVDVGKAPIANPNVVPVYDLETDQTTGACFLYYKRRRIVDFAGIPL